jgi:chorismate mutase/prephenate dehydrogenase
MAVAEELARRRAQLVQLDAELQRLVARRLQIARQIGEIKRSIGRPFRDYAVEREVLARWRNALGRWDIPPERTDELVRWLVEEALYAQESLDDAPPGVPSPSDIVVVGGSGQMGAWIRDFLRSEGHRVGIVDPRADPQRARGYTVHADLGRAAQDADAVVVATPMRAATSVYRELYSTETEATIFDVLSIKAPLLPWIRRGIDRGFHVTSVHPLFGPGARSLSGRNLLVLDCGDPVANARAQALFAASSLAITQMPIERHDAIMADVLGLPHALALLFGQALARAGRTEAELARLASVSYRRTSEVARIVTGENPELAYDIQNLNPASAALFDRLETALRAVRAAVRDGDAAAYRRMMEEARAALARPSEPRGASSAESGTERPSPVRPRLGPPAREPTRLAPLSSPAGAERSGDEHA